MSTRAELTGVSIIGGRPAGRHEDTFRAYQPADGRAIDPVYVSASDSEVNQAVELAAAAAPALAATSGGDRASAAACHGRRPR